MPACASTDRPPGHYRPRNAQANPLYRLLQDNLEEYLARGDRDSTFHPAVAEQSFRAFLECGVPRFGMVRFRCPSCKEDLFVAFSCKRRGACSSCDAKRAAVTAAHALDALLPEVAYRQWVFVLPKRLRYFVHRSPALAGEASRILAREIDLFLRRKLGEGSATQIHFLQRFGSTLNLHLHVHAVVSASSGERAGAWAANGWSLCAPRLPLRPRSRGWSSPCGERFSAAL
ncbi:MAG: transposase zinc-binding domain-containing protein [Elusimicrobia bacterium]|nr:transposase zinc-binding domain-containing protein [Elusimicrobiota bacterium]